VSRAAAINAYKAAHLQPPPAAPPARVMNWVRIKKAAEYSGYTEKAIRRKMQDGVWLQGILWTKAPDGCIFINLEAVETWIKSQVGRA
jgi:hypothetical protein